MTPEDRAFIVESRAAVRDIVQGKDDRLLVIVGAFEEHTRSMKGSGIDDLLYVLVFVKKKKKKSPAGPCSVHDPTAALEYAKRLQEIRERFAEHLMIVMRSVNAVSVLKCSLISSAFFKGVL